MGKTIMLTVEEDAEAHEMGAARYSEYKTEHRHGFVTREQCILGDQGGMAVARHLGIQHPQWGMREGFLKDELHRGTDVGPYQVRTRSEAWHDLNLHPGDRGLFILVLGHNAPRMFLFGEITAEKGFQKGIWREDGTGYKSWCYVPRRFLTAIGEDDWIIEPQTPFWCEVCGGLHPIIEHRICRASA